MFYKSVLFSHQRMGSVNLKNKIASYFTSKMSLFRNSRRNAIWNIPTEVKHRQVQEWRRGACFYRGKEEVGGQFLKKRLVGERNSGLWQLLIGWDEVVSHWLARNQVFCIEWLCPSVPGRTFFGYHVPQWRESAQVGNHLGHIWVKRKGRRENSGISDLKYLSC